MTLSFLISEQISQPSSAQVHNFIVHSRISLKTPCSPVRNFIVDEHWLFMKNKVVDSQNKVADYKNKVMD
jgi:hypothetical protein